jgi:endonuclease G
MFDNDKIKDMLARLASDDDELGGELRERLDRPVAEAAPGPRVAVLGGAPRAGPPLTAETIVLRTGRPVLAIKQNDVVLEFRDADSQVWKQRLINARANLGKPILAVGRIDLVGHPDYEWVGTGWLVRPNILATNRHVAEIFARSSGDRFTFRLGVSRRPISASIDFLREAGNRDRKAFQIQEVLHIEGADGPDLALMRVAAIPGAQPIQLATSEPRARTQVAVIGYPARDSRIPDQDLMEDLFGNVYDCKRLAPGQIKGIEHGLLTHDCSTLGGNSGSVVLDLATGKALGIHFAGRFLEANFAVPARVIEQRVQNVERPGRRPLPFRIRGVPDAPQSQAVMAGGNGLGKIECVIPLKLTIEWGAPIPDDSEPTTDAPPED